MSGACRRMALSGLREMSDLSPQSECADIDQVAVTVGDFMSTGP
jgi:hypothetical protein